MKQMCYGAVDTMTRAAVFDTLNGRTNFAKMDAMNPDDPDTVSRQWPLLVWFSTWCIHMLPSAPT